MRIWFLGWLYQWARVVDGLLGVLTLGLVSTHISLTAASVLAKARFEKKGFKLEGKKGGLK